MADTRQLIKDASINRSVNCIDTLMIRLTDQEQSESVLNEIQQFGAQKFADCLLENDPTDLLSATRYIELLAECLKDEDVRKELSTEKVVRSLLEPFVVNDRVSEQRIDEILSTYPDLVRQICRALGNICFEHDLGRELVIANGGLQFLPPLIKLLILRGVPGEDGAFSYIVMGCLFNLGESDFGQDCMLKIPSFLPLLIESIPAFSCDAAGQTSNLIFGLSENKNWIPVFQAHFNELLEVVRDYREDEQVTEALLETMQLVCLKAEKPLGLLECGLWPIVKSHLDSGFTKIASDVTVSLLTDDDCMKKLFDNGKGEAYLIMKSWLQHEDEEKRASATLAIGNFARENENCIFLVNDRIPDTLSSILSDKRQNTEIKHGALAALRNILVCEPCRAQLVQTDLLNVLLSLLPIEDLSIVFKFLGCLRMMCDRQPLMAERLGTNRELIEHMVKWCNIEIHHGVKCEALRCLCWILKNNTADHIRSTLASLGAVDKIATMMNMNEHNIMKNESLIAMSLMTNDNPEEFIVTAIQKNLPSITKGITRIIQDDLDLSPELVENAMVIVINITLLSDGFKKSLKEELGEPLKNLINRTERALLREKTFKAISALEIDT